MLEKETILRMAEVKDQWCVSVYMPIRQADSRKNNIRLRNLISEAKKKLLDLGMYPLKASSMLAPIDMILDNAEFWRNRRDGFVAFFTQGSFVWYTLPYVFKELVVVTDQLHLKPLLRNALQHRRFHILTLSQNTIRFFEASEMGINELFPKGLPRNLGYVFSPESQKQLQMHSGAKGSSIVHGQGNIKDVRKAQITELARRTDKVVADYLKKNESPLLLAGVEYLQAIYREVNSCRQLLDIGLTGNVDKLSPKTILEKALPLVRPAFRRTRKKAERVYQEKLGTGLALDDFSEVFEASVDGRIDTLFVPVGKQKWGTLDHKTNKVQIHANAKPGDKDLLCVTSTNTLLKGGKVFAVLPEQMPGNSTVAAILRY